MEINPRLLLATEDITLARTLSWVLKENGYDVVTAIGGPALFDRLEQEEYELIVVDVGSADAGRMDRLATVRNDNRYQDTPLFILADKDFDTARLESFGLGATDVAHRPYRIRELLTRLKAHLRIGRELNRSRSEARTRSEMLEILKEVTAALSPEKIYQILVRRVAQGLHVGRCSVVLAAPGDKEGTVVAAYENPTLRDLRVDLARYPEIIRAFESGQTVLVSNVDADPMYQDVRSTWGVGAVGQQTRSVIALPFALHGHLAGVFFLRTTSDDPPLNELDLGFAEQVIEAAVAALE